MSSSACDFTCCTCSTIGAGSAHRRPPARTSTACATASVSGSVSTNVCPCPARSTTSTRPPSAAISLRTTSMPMPRPGNLRDACVAVENPGWNRHSISCASVGDASAATMPCATARSRTRAKSMPRAVVGDLDHDFVADLPHRQRDFAGLRLARVAPRLARLDAVIERVAQQVLERADQLFQHRAVELDLRAVDLEVGALVELLRRRAQDPVQALGQAAERHRADREQPLLHVARQPRLREQRGVGVVQVLEQRLLHRRDVVDAFGERARELLEPRVAVELQRVEVAVLLLQLHLRLDLRLGLDLDLAHLRAQADHAARSARAGWT